MYSQMRSACRASCLFASLACRVVKPYCLPHYPKEQCRRDRKMCNMTFVALLDLFDEGLFTGSSCDRAVRHRRNTVCTLWPFAIQLDRLDETLTVATADSGQSKHQRSYRFCKTLVAVFMVPSKHNRVCDRLVANPSDGLPTPLRLVASRIHGNLGFGQR